MAGRKLHRGGKGASIWARTMPAGIVAVVIAILATEASLLWRAMVGSPLPATTQSPTVPSTPLARPAVPDASSAAGFLEGPRSMRVTATPGPEIGGLLENEVLARAQRHQRNGDYAAAGAAYRALRSGFPDSPAAAQAAYSLGQMLLEDEDYAAAATALHDFLDSYPDDRRVPAATYLLATAYEALDEQALMHDAYRRFAQVAGPLAPYAALKMADLYLASGDHTAAARALQGADDEDLPPATRAEIFAALGRAYEGGGQFASAVEQYEKATALADSEEERAALIYRVAAVAAQAGDQVKAARATTALLSEYPDSTAARRALRLADEIAPAATSPFTRGLVLYHAGEYTAATEAFAQQIADAPASPLASEARYYAGRAHKAAGRCQDAATVFDRLVATYPESRRIPEALLHKGRCLAMLGSSAAALETFAQVANWYPQAAAAADALWESASMLEEDGRLAEAATRYAALAAAHPQERRAAAALFRQGFLHWRLDDDRLAVEVWDRLAQVDAPAEARVQALYWAGKTLLALGDTAGARQRLERAAATKPDDYYAARARAVAEEQLGLALAPPSRPPGDLTQEIPALEQWAFDAAGMPAAEVEVAGSLEQVAAELRRDRAFQRGEQLLALGRRREALREFDHAGKKHRAEPIWLVRYAVYAEENGLYGEAMAAARRALALAGTDSIYAAPRRLQRLVYPTCYEDLVMAEAKRYALDPWLLFALIRQESACNATARSSADARGLTQVIPSTARDIADALGRADFQVDDLYKPHISIAFGAWYLWAQLGSFRENVAMALAAYNGGGRNAERWATLDPDAYFEIIDFPETRSYVRLVSGYAEAYRQIYGR